LNPRPASRAIGGSWPSGWTEQAIERIPNHAVALAGSAFEAWPVSNGHAACAVADQPRPLQSARRNRNAGPADTEHHGKRLMGHREFVAVSPVVRHQQLESEALADLVSGIAGRQLCRLQVPGQNIGQNKVAECRELIRHFTERRRVETEGSTGTLDLCLNASAVTAEKNSEANDTLAANDSDLGTAAIREGRQDGEPAALGEVGGLHRIALPAQGMMFRHCKRLKPGPQPGKLVGREGCKNAVTRDRDRLINKRQLTLPQLGLNGVQFLPDARSRPSILLPCVFALCP
jgi:hypothetical protein